MTFLAVPPMDAFTLEARLGIRSIDQNWIHRINVDVKLGVVERS